MRKLSENEAFQEERRKFKELNGKQKLQYIWDYYKIPIIATIAAVLMIGSYIHTLVTEKDAVLYHTAVDFEFDELLVQRLDTDYISDCLQGDPKKQEVFLDTTAYVTSDDLESANYQYAMAMQTKLMANLSSGRIDILLMDQKGFEGFSNEGYLMELDTFLPEQDPELYSELQPLLKDATVTLSDNSKEVAINPEIEYEAVTEVQTTGIDVSGWKIFTDAQVPSPLYLGIIGNTERTDEVLQYLRYLMDYK